MKRNIIYIIISVAALLNSCEENFSPKADYKEKYILYCIINIDSSLQTAVLEKSYDVNGFDPYQNTSDPLIPNADIRIRQRDNVFFMRDTTTDRSDTSRYESPIHFYYTNNFYLKGNDSLEILATLPNGKKLYGITNLAESIEFDKATNHLLPAQDTEFASFIWKGAVSSRWYLPKLEFIYFKDGIRYIKQIPSGYEIKNGKSIPVFPAVTNNNVIRFQNYAIDSAMTQISAGDPNKSNYKIYGCVFTLLNFNQSLSNYYSTSNGFLDDFTVRVDESDYTNIQGGLGVFGTIKKQITGAVFTEDYIKSFGYTPGLN